MTAETINAYWWLPLAGYLIGSAPFGFLIARVAGQRDIRASGSGSIGATNVTRIAGPAAGALTLCLDAAKGALSVWLAARVTGYAAVWMIAAAVGAIIGHVFPIWLAGRGGRGVATGLGAYLVICWPAAVAALAIWLAVVGASRYVSLGSLIATASLPVLVYFLYSPGHAPAHAISVGTTIGATLIIVQHRPNIARLIEGTESRISFRRGRANS
ncbi:MAG TPA: glycerol-3-phosphate 1-O-acyltransferase PlsY [Candidatus Acidoferrum sp.]|nr:glycerol-3-phosphate 1-O-acyltransferase PlsY [Candidatus Acidoferrum sp.]